VEVVCFSATFVRICQIAQCDDHRRPSFKIVLFSPGSITYLTTVYLHVDRLEPNLQVGHRVECAYNVSLRVRVNSFFHTSVGRP